MEDLFDLRQRDEILITDLQGKNGSSLRFRPRQNGHGHLVVQHLERLRQIPEKRGRRRVLRRKSENHGHQESLSKGHRQSHDRDRKFMERLRGFRAVHQLFDRREVNDGKESRLHERSPCCQGVRGKIS